MIETKDYKMDKNAMWNNLNHRVKNYEYVTKKSCGFLGLFLVIKLFNQTIFFNPQRTGVLYKRKGQGGGGNIMPPPPALRVKVII